jgi:hypothetical protein
MNRTIGFAMMAVAGLALLSSCTKDPLDNITEEESRIYITNRDSSANFSTYKTYSIVDSVSVIDNNRFAGKQTTSWDLAIIAALRNAMESRGFVKVDKAQSPDLGINISRLYNTTTNLVNLSDYYGGYGGYYDPYYWGYGGYNYYFPPAYGYYQSTEAMASIDILDLKNASGSGSIKGVWNGLIRGSGIFNSNTVNSQVTALFDQSPYIKAQ